MTQDFNPFTDRLSRDIRNKLSVSLAEAINMRSLEPVLAVADHFLAGNIPEDHQHYITSRLQRYESALEKVPATADDHLAIAVILWDLGLFFEVHEILEPPWMKAQGDRKLLLQALIRAAGVYINLELGYTDRATKISGKALPVLTRLEQELKMNMNVGELIATLQELTPEAPHIGL